MWEQPCLSIVVNLRETKCSTVRTTCQESSEKEKQITIESKLQYWQL